MADLKSLDARAMLFRAWTRLANGDDRDDILEEVSAWIIMNIPSAATESPSFDPVPDGSPPPDESWRLKMRTGPQSPIEPTTETSSGS